MIKVKFITGGANSAFGGFCPGDVLVCSEAMAKHLVDDIGCARYDVVTEPETVELKDVDTPKRSRKAKG